MAITYILFREIPAGSTTFNHVYEGPYTAEEIEAVYTKAMARRVPNESVIKIELGKHYPIEAI